LTEQSAGKTKSQKLRDRWINRIEREKKVHKDFRDSAKEAMKVCQRDSKMKKGDLANVFPVYWANVEIMHAVLFKGPPLPDVRRRYKDQAESSIAEAVQNAIGFVLDTEEYEAPYSRAVNEWLYGGLGQIKFNYAPEFAQEQVYTVIEETGEQIPALDDDGNPVTQEVIAYQTVEPEYFPWDRFHWDNATEWKKVRWVAYRSVLPVHEVEREYKVTIKTDSMPDSEDREYGDPKGKRDEISVYEVWDKENRQVVVVTGSHDEPLEARDDKLNLKGFFPSPRPLMMNIRTGDIEPRPDYHFICDQIWNINRLTERITTLSRMVRYCGAIDEAAAEVFGDLENAKDGEFSPVNGGAERFGGDLNNALMVVDVAGIVGVITALRQERIEQIQQLYELTGIADIARGATNPNETAAAQTIKGQFAQTRLAKKSSELERYYRDSYRIIAEIMTEHFTAENMFYMSGIQVDENVLRQLRSDIGRTFLIDVETEDSIIEGDQKSRTEALEAINTLTGLMVSMMPAVNDGTLPADMAKAFMQLASKQFKDGRIIEDSVDSMIETNEQLQQLLQQSQQLQQQLEQAIEENQQLQQQLGQVDQQEQVRKNVQTQADVRSKEAEAFKDEAFGAAQIANANPGIASLEASQ